MSAVKRATAPLPTAVPCLIGRCVFIKRGPFQGRLAKVICQVSADTYQVLLPAPQSGPMIVRRDDVIVGRRGHGQKRVRG